MYQINKHILVKNCCLLQLIDVTLGWTKCAPFHQGLQFICEVTYYSVGTVHLGSLDTVIHLNPMINLVDPVKILLCGGYGVGKTSLVSRLASKGFAREYQPTAGINVVEFSAKLKHSASIMVTVIDLGADLVLTQTDPELIPSITCDIDGAFIVVDGQKSQYLKDVSYWIDMTINMNKRKIFKYLLVNKADMSESGKTFFPTELDALVQSASLEGWALTVGHPDLGDFDCSRGSIINQKSAEELLQKLVLTILLKRQSNFCKLLPVPFAIEFGRLTSYDYSEVHRYKENSLTR